MMVSLADLNARIDRGELELRKWRAAAMGLVLVAVLFPLMPNSSLASKGRGTSDGTSSAYSERTPPAKSSTAVDGRGSTGWH